MQKQTNTQFESVNAGAFKRSVKLHALGFVTGAAIAIEEDKSVAETLNYGLYGMIGTLFFEAAFPKTANLVKRIIANA